MSITIQDLAAKPIKVELKHPTTDEALGVFVTIVGKNSRRFKDRFYQSVAEAQAEPKELPNGEKMLAAERRGAELIATCIIGWDNQEFFGGEYTPERAMDLVVQPELSWVKDQVEVAILDSDRFFSK